jgi:salicylate hydroxylase
MRLPSREEGKNATYRIRRSSLIASLRQAAGDVPIHFGAECVGYDGAKLQFADGTSATADWVVGADGVASVLRRTIVDDDRHYLGLSAIVGDGPASFDHPLLSGGNFLMIGDDGSSVFCYPQQGGTHLSYATHADEDAIADGAEALTVLRERVTDWASPVPEIVAALDPATFVVRGYYDKEPPTTVHRGPLWLIGDAAHPVAPFLGQGANMAMVDGLRLAKTIAGGASPEQLDDDIVRRARKAVLDSRKMAAMIHVTDRKKQSRRNRSWRFADFFINLFS